MSAPGRGTLCLSLPLGRECFFPAVKSVSVQFGHVWTDGCSAAAAAVGQRLPLAAEPGSGGSAGPWTR